MMRRRWRAPAAEGANSQPPSLAQGKTASLAALLASRASRRAVALTVLLILNQQLSGLFALLSYVVFIFMEAEVPVSPYACSLVVGAMLTVGSLPCVFLVDRWGRRSLLAVSDALMALALFAVGLHAHLRRPLWGPAAADAASSLSWLPLAALSLYMLVFNLGLGSLPPLVVTEIFAPELVGAALALNGPLAGIPSFFITRYYPYVASTLGVDVCFWFFSASCIIGTVLIILYLPETKDQPIESVIRKLEGTNRSGSRKSSYEVVKTELCDTNVIYTSKEAEAQKIYSTI